MVNKTFLPPSSISGKTPNPFNGHHFPTWHGFR
jgi:hypothetical protein